MRARDKSIGQGTEMAGKDTANAPAFSRLETLTAVIVVGVLALALGLVALVRPTHTTDKKTVSYTQSGSFSYSADAPTPSLYGAKGLTTGAPILTEVVGPVTTSFGYRFTSQAPASLHGNASLTATVKLGQGLSRKFPVAARQPFTGNRVRVSGTLPVKAIVVYVHKVQSSLSDSDSGLGDSATITMEPSVELTGSLAGHRLKAAYAPTLPFSLNGTTLTIGQGDTASADQPASDALKPSKQGRVAYRADTTNTVPLLIAHPSVLLARIIGFGLAGLCLLLGLFVARPLLRDDPKNEPVKIRTLYGSHIIEVRDLSTHDGPVAQVASMESLADLAKKYESMIMHVARPEGDVYLVWDNGMTYQYQPATSGGPRSSATTRGEDGQVLTRNETVSLNGATRR
jgi:hypothetical protein